jgi:glycosyltransferase involved in cell wall biosynthesis
MKILFADFDLPYRMRDADHPFGGWSVELGAWLGALKRSGHQAGVLTWRGAGQYVGDQDLCTLLETYDPKTGIRFAKYLYSYIPAMLRAARRFEPDVVVQSCAGVQTGMLAWIARRLGVPFVHRLASDVDADDRYKAKLSPVEQAAFRYGLRNSAAFLCQNGYQSDSLHARYPRASLSVVHNPIELPGNLPPVLPRGERHYVAWLGVFKKAKDLPLLLELANNHPGVSFRVGGNEGKGIDAATKAAVAQLKTLPNVEMAGYVARTKVYDFLSSASALLSTSSYEGFSNAILEALAAGTPVIARRAVDPDLILTRNTLGLIADDASGLSEMIVRLQSMNPAEYSALAARCRTYVVSHHSGAAKARELIATLEPLVERGGRA